MNGIRTASHRGAWNKGKLVGQRRRSTSMRSGRSGFSSGGEALRDPALFDLGIDSKQRRIKNLRAVQRLIGHTKLESTVRYLGIEADDALEIAEQIEV